MSEESTLFGADPGRARGESIGPPSVLAALRGRGPAARVASASEERRDRNARGTRYTVESEIGRGGMGVVLQVRDHDLRRSVAMKVALRRPGSDDRARVLDRFLDEAQITGQLSHPGVPPVHELGTASDGAPYFTMALIRGETLDRVLAQWRAGAGGWTLARVLRVFLRICETVGFAHERGVVHRDLKPANVMVGRLGEVYVMDWGLAAARGGDGGTADDAGSRAATTVVETPRTGTDSDDAWRTADGTVLGTPAYMPPEQAAGRIGELDARADVYAIGAMLYELLAGHPPYVEPGVAIPTPTLLACVLMGPPRAIDEAAPAAAAELRAVVDRATARSPSDRHGSAAELGEEIARYLDSLERARKDAEVREATAVAARRQAEDLIGFFLGEIDDSSAFLADPDAKGRVAARLAEWFAELPTGSLSAVERRSYGAALLWLQGSAADPQEALVRAEETVRVTAPDADREDAELVTLHVEALCRVAEGRRRSGDRNGALCAIRAAEALAPRVTVAAFSVPEPSIARGRVRLELANCLAESGDGSAWLQLRMAREALHGAETSAGLELRGNVGLALDALEESMPAGDAADVLPTERTEVSAVLVDAWSAFDAAASASPWNPRYPLMRAVARVLAGRRLRQCGAPEQAVVTLEQAIAALDRTWSVGERDGRRRFWRAVAEPQHAVALDEQGASAEAAGAHERARRLTAEIAAPAALPHRDQLLVAEWEAHHGAFLARAGRAADAQRHFESARSRIAAPEHCWACRRLDGILRRRGGAIRG